MGAPDPIFGTWSGSTAAPTTSAGGGGDANPYGTWSPAASSPAAPPSGGGSDANLFGTWGSGGGAGTIPGVTPTPAAAPADHGGGLGGWLGNQVSAAFDAVKGAPAGIARLGEDLVKAPIDVGEKVINTGGAELGNAVGANLDPNLGNQFARSTSWNNAPSAMQELNTPPAITGTLQGIHTLVGHGIGNAELLANAPSALLRLTGRVSGDTAAANAPDIVGHSLQR